MRYRGRHDIAVIRSVFHTKSPVCMNSESKQKIEAIIAKQLYIPKKTIDIPKKSVRKIKERKYIPTDESSASSMMGCQVRMVRATMVSSVRMSAVKLMATMWRKSSSNSSSAPNMMTPPW